MKVKEGSAEAKLHLNIKKTGIMTTEEIYFYINKEDKLLSVCWPWISHQFKWRLQPRNQEKTETWKGSNERIRKDHQKHRCVIKDQAKIIHIPVFPITMHGCEKWTVKKAERKKLICFHMVLEENSTDTLDHQEEEQVGTRANKAWNIIERKKWQNWSSPTLGT